jgi:hypothetical protein
VGEWPGDENHKKGKEGKWRCGNAETDREKELGSLDVKKRSGATDQMWQFESVSYLPFARHLYGCSRLASLSLCM